MRRVKTVAIFLVMFLLVSALYGCNSQKDSMIVGVDFASNKHWPLNPFQSIGRNDVNLLVYDSLFTIDEHGFAEPSVVKSFVQEGSLYKITLNEGIKFHNGKELTSADVADTLLRIIYVHGINEDNIPELFSALEKIDLVSKYELVFTLKNPDMMFWNKLTFGITPAYNPNQVEDKPWPATIEKKNLSLVYINVNEDGHNGQVITDAYTKSTPVGSGPWQFEKESYNTFITSNKPTKVELTKNEDYWKGNVGIEKVTLQKVENGVYSVNSYLLTKSIDISPWTSPLWGDLSQMEYYSKFKTAEHLSLIQYLPSTTTQTIYFTKTNDTVKEHLVRQAIAYAIDREALLAAQTEQDGSSGIVTQEYLMPEHPWYFEIENPYEYNVEKARELLKEAGYEQGLTVIGRSSLNDVNQWKKTVVAKELNRQFSEVGITIDWLLPSSIEDFNVQLQRLPVLGISSVITFMNEKDRPFFEKYNDSIVQILEEMMGNTDVDIQKQKYQEALQEIHDQAYTVPLINENHYYAYNNRIQGLELTNPNQILVDLWQTTLK